MLCCDLLDLVVKLVPARADVRIGPVAAGCSHRGGGCYNSLRIAIEVRSAQMSWRQQQVERVLTLARCKQRRRSDEVLRHVLN